MTPARLELDFRGRRRVSGLGLVILAAACGLLGVAFAMQWSADTSIARLEHQLKELVPPASSDAAAEPLPATTTEYMSTVLGRLELPWEGFFRALEAVVDQDVTLLSIAPNAARGTVQLQGEARDLYSALRYVKALEDGGYFRSVELTEHEIGKAPPSLPVRFVIAAHWNAVGRSR